MVHIVCNLNKEIFKGISEMIITAEVIITEERIGHIKNRHPNDYERYCNYLKTIIEEPDYIIKLNKMYSAILLKEINEDRECFKAIIRLCTSHDNPEYKNSIITFMRINTSEWNGLIRNKEVLYKRE